MRARSKRGAIALTWWSGRFIEVLEAIVVGGRLLRGRTYARRGQVINVDLLPGMVTAQVQGSRAEPYRVRIGLTAFGKADAGETSGPAPDENQGDFFVQRGDLPMRRAAPTAPEALLDQLPPVDLTIRGRPLIDLLRGRPAGPSEGWPVPTTTRRRGELRADDQRPPARALGVC